jgi:hypothetical protein
MSWLECSSLRLPRLNGLVAYEQQQVLMATNAYIENKVALYGAYDRTQDLEMPYSLTESAYKF